jgi:hypothetical protein
MNTYTARYERFKGKAKKGGNSRGGAKVPKKPMLERPVEVPPPFESVAAEVPAPDPLTSPTPVNIPASDNFVNLRDDDEEEDEDPVVFQRKRKTVEGDAGEDAEAKAKRAKKGKGNDDTCIFFVVLGIFLPRHYQYHLFLMYFCSCGRY